MKTTSPFGSWKSPITSKLITTSSVGLNDIRLDGNSIYWTELRPAEGGRVLVVEHKDGENIERTPPNLNVRTRVHEYGGGSYGVFDGTVYFSDFASQHLHSQKGTDAPTILNNDQGMRYADSIIDRERNRLICVREDHTDPDREAQNSIVSIDLTSGAATVLTDGNDFYSTPTLSPDGRTLAWLTWHHPNMPWDSTELFVAEINEDGSLMNPVLVAGGAEESVFQPSWSPNGDLYFVSDRSNWWNLYSFKYGQTEAVYPLEAEFAFPQWVFGFSTYSFIDENRIIATYTRNGLWELAILDLEKKQLTRVESNYTDFSSLRCNKHFAVYRASSATRGATYIKLDFETGKETILKYSKSESVDDSYISQAESIEFPTENGKTAHALYYAPKNPEFVAPEGEKPPLIVMSHGGPTAAASSELNLSVQYWTSRGFAVVDVNYGGSTGYGREYRERLQDTWGIVDVDDCVNAAKYLVERGLADEDRLSITGGSAGGYTTLSALTFRDVFTAGSSHFGISDLEAMTRDTHKFESRYLDGLVGPYPDRKDLYEERSPIHFTDKLSCPLIIFQGLEDKIVPPNQAEMMVDALRKKGLPVAYVAFEGEQHGFRKAENIQRALDSELDFYSRIFGFEPADEIEPVEIENFKAKGA